jgi:hypothetical protein
MAFAIDEEFVCCHIARFGFLEVSKFEVTVPNVCPVLSILRNETTPAPEGMIAECWNVTCIFVIFLSLFGFNSSNLI